MGMSWQQCWEAAERTLAPPTRVRHLVVRPYDHVVHSMSLRGFAEQMVWSLYRGDIWLLKGAFDSAFMAELKAKTVAYMRENVSSFHKMLEGSPDFHRPIDLETGKKYAFQGCKHSAYFYRWNDDPLGIWPAITERWRVAKTIMGLRPDEYEVNTPKDGVVDRIQVVRYPPAIGYLEPHADPHLHQRLFFSGYMSKRGQDYQGGGFYAVGQNDEVRQVEDMIDVGDVCLGYATVYHGVAPCDRDTVPDWDADDGRWFLSMYSNASDEVPQRHTGRPVKLNLPGVLP